MRNLILVLLILFSLTAATAFLTRDTVPTGSQQNRTSDKIQKTSVNPKAVLNFSPANLDLAYGQTGSVSLRVIYQGDKPDFAQIELGYDPEIITDISVTPGNFFESPSVVLDSIDDYSGRASFAIKSLDKQAQSDYDDVLVNISFRITGRNADSAIIYFLPKTKMSADKKDIELEIPEWLKINILNSVTPIAPYPSI